MRSLRILMAAPLLGLGLAASPVHAAPTAAMPFHATLQANQESPPGPSGGAGTAKITIDGNNLCYDLSWNAATGNAVVAHIHQGPAGTSGPIVEPLSATKTHTCTVVSPSVSQGMASNPSGYYVNIHTDKYPDGAIRGQLAAG